MTGKQSRRERQKGSGNDGMEVMNSLDEVHKVRNNRLQTRREGGKGKDLRGKEKKGMEKKITSERKVRMVSVQTRGKTREGGTVGRQSKEEEKEK